MVHDAMHIHRLAVEGGLDILEVLERDAGGLVDEAEAAGRVVLRVGATALLALAAVAWPGLRQQLPDGQLPGLGCTRQQYHPAAPWPYGCEFSGGHLEQAAGSIVRLVVPM